MGVVHIPWYANGFRHNKLADALAGIAPVALRYGANWYQVHRYRDDLYKFLQVAEFDDKFDFDRYWAGPEFTDFRVICSSWYQVPVLYSWSDLVATGALGTEANGNGTAVAAHTEQGGGVAG